MFCDDCEFHLCFVMVVSCSLMITSKQEEERHLCFVITVSSAFMFCDDCKL